MNNKISSIYDICRRKNQEILFDEETNQYFIHLEKASGMLEKFVSFALIIMTIIIREVSKAFNSTWMNLLTYNIFRVLIAAFLIIYIFFVYIATRRYCNNNCKKNCSIISEECLGLTVNDIKNGEGNLKKICIVLSVLFFATVIVFALLFKYKTFSLFVLLLLVLFCLTFLYALALPQKRKRFYEKYKKKQCNKI